MDFVPPPLPDDVDWDTGPYSRDELVVARASLLHGLQRETGGLWQTIKFKLGILPNGHRLRTFEAQHIWLPPQLPHLWSAPVVLHDPNNPLSTITIDDDNEDDDDDEEKANKEEGEARSSSPSAASSSSSHSNVRAGRANSEPSSNNNKSDDDNKRASASFSRKRKWDSSHHSEDQSVCDLTHDDNEDDDDDISQKKGKKKSPTKKRRVGGDGHESSNVNVIELSSEEDEKEKEYVHVHQCDVCGFQVPSQDHLEMHCHLDRQKHCSSSLYLARWTTDPKGGESKLSPVYLSVASKIQKRQYAFKEKVVFCHACHTAFTSLAQCLQHTLQAHKNCRYCLRDVITEEEVILERNITQCPDCGLRVPDRELVTHSRKTQHMSLYIGKKSVGATMFFVCPFCKAPFSDYVSFKAHVFSDRHAEEVGDRVRAMQSRLGPSIPKTMLPQDPGGLKISTEQGPSSSQPSKKNSARKHVKKASAKSWKKQSKKMLKERLAAIKAETKRNLS